MFQGFTSPKWYQYSAVYSMTPSSSMHLDFNSFLAWQRIHFGDNPAGSKGFSRHPCHAPQGKCNKERSTRHGYSPSATPYIPHSPVSSHSLVRLHSPISSHSPVSSTALQVYTALNHVDSSVCSHSPVGPHTALVVCTCYSNDSLQWLYTNSFLTVSNRVSSSVAVVAMLTFTALHSHSSKSM